jgi:hypothetical protein
LHTARGVSLSHTAESTRKDGPRITAALSVFTRDDDRYWHRQPSDHGPDGLFTGGPKGESNPIARLQSFTHCEVTASSPDAERRQYVAYKARGAVMLGGFLAPRKPMNSGRKRRAA